MNLAALYRQMLRSRRFEEAVVGLFEDGLISGEMHLGIGEEGIAAGVAAHLIAGDALALDHRGTPPLLMHGVEPSSILMELLGLPEGLNGGRGGHMHMLSKEHLAASSGIVGAAGPAAVGFALAATHLRPGTIAVAYFGEGAINQGMLMESFNLAVVWNLPVLFVCKDNGVAITSRSTALTGGSPVERARGFGLKATTVDGSKVDEVWAVAGDLIEGLRSDDGPAFLHATCTRPYGHLIGDPVLRSAQAPIKELRQRGGPLVRSVTARDGAKLGERIRSLRNISGSVAKTVVEHGRKGFDPLSLARRQLSTDAILAQLETEVEAEIDQALSESLAQLKLAKEV
ncbi:MAG: thiamine pyrophosphate-dependent dehydrogenase E1 component subunit alpha [Candidatus Neomarinimicrobiota bacterium]